MRREGEVLVRLGEALAVSINVPVLVSVNRMLVSAKRIEWRYGTVIDVTGGGSIDHPRS